MEKQRIHKIKLLEGNKSLIMEENKEKLLPKINRKINDFLYEEEGNISRGKILTVGSLLLIAGMMKKKYLIRQKKT